MSPSATGRRRSPEARRYAEGRRCRRARRGLSELARPAGSGGPAPRSSELAGPGGSGTSPGAAPAWDAGSVEVAAWILSEANAHAAEIRHEARDQAAASLSDAKKEAAELLRQASERAAAKLAAVESEAAQVQAALLKLSTELSEVAGGPRTRSPASCPDRCRSR